VAILVMLYGLALAASVFLMFTGREELGIAGVLMVLTLAPLAFVLALPAAGVEQRRAAQRMEEVVHQLRRMSEQASLSDDARRVLNRREEREVLRRAIEEDIASENYDAAMVLVKELADRFGFRTDAEELRKRIEQSRSARLDQDVKDAIGYLDGLIFQKRWDDARRETARIQRLFPDVPRVEGLRGRVEQAFSNHKVELERRLLLAAREGRADDAMVVLKELDGYLTPSEAEPLRELARGVIGKARENLGAQFKLAVQDRRWKDAVDLGERIIAEFPNTRMAAEVREVIDGVRSKAQTALQA
jgi:hypothetical protein